MNIAIASDHRGLELLEVVRSELHAQDMKSTPWA